MTKSRRPNLWVAIQEFMGRREIASWSQLVRDMKEAGHPTPNLSASNIHNWINRNKSLGDEFFLWLHRTYNLSEIEQDRLMEALRRDLFKS